MSRWSRAVLGNRVVDLIWSVYEYVVYKKNPIIMSVYLLLAIGGFAVYIVHGFLRFIPGPYIAGYHRTLGTILMLACYWSFYLAWSSNPGIITKSSHKKAMRKFDYDDIMYIKGSECSTCKFAKPARSKHCAVCD